MRGDADDARRAGNEVLSRTWSRGRREASIRNDFQDQRIVVRLRREAVVDDETTTLTSTGYGSSRSDSDSISTGVRPSAPDNVQLNTDNYINNATTIANTQSTVASRSASSYTARGETVAWPGTWPGTSMTSQRHDLTSSTSTSSSTDIDVTADNMNITMTTIATAGDRDVSALITQSPTRTTASSSSSSPPSSSSSFSSSSSPRSPSPAHSNRSTSPNNTIDTSVRTAVSVSSSSASARPTGFSQTASSVGSTGVQTQSGSTVGHRSTVGGQRDVRMTTSAVQLRSTTARTTLKQDQQNRKYYALSYLNNDLAMYYWTNEAIILNGMPHEVLQHEHLSAMTVELSFPFLFYGHEVYEVTIATGGFLYMSDFLYSQLTFSQYIAPLMANFDTSISSLSHIHYLDNGTAFTVWWENVYLGDQFTDKPFSFQVILYNTSEIAFIYKSIPMPVSDISTKNHAVKVGLSDAYYFDQTSYNGYTHRTISVYSRIDVNMTLISDNTAVIISPLPTCIIQNSCASCLNATNSTSFVCHWCVQLSRCSDGLDRQRQTWLKYGCATERVTSLGGCFTSNDGDVIISAESDNTAGAVGVLLVMIAIVLLVAIVTWIIFAIKNPTSSSGQWLIQHRPQVLFNRVRHSGCWCFQREETVSNYVTFHSGLESTYA